MILTRVMRSSLSPLWCSSLLCSRRVMLASHSALLVSCASSRIVFCSAPPCLIFSSRHSETFTLLRRGVVHIFLSNFSAKLCLPFKYKVLLIDSLDTLALLGDCDRFAASVEWIGKNIRFDILQNKTVSLFETTIRVLGGLLSAHLIANDYATDEEHENKGKDESCEAAESGASEREDATDEVMI
ncbi:hypothetical protein Ahy_A05g023963 [Arachis hypogaea]|uniref:alpha-1,2-Mannosidase n=1 Tax=Arachis hypogaea TaxID=3818 RepID=A0A445D520_ARAHY|nr:hypothetical protein Ahy_A05g023963 [Arachis hypogaea]